MTKRQIIYALALFAFVESLLVGGIYLYFSRQENEFLEEGYADMTRSFSSVLYTYEILSQATFNETINKPSVVEKVAKAIAADKAVKDKLRADLYNQLQHTYNTLQLYHLNQIHFHHPDLTSFLRMHRPSAYGDNLSKVRPSIVMANQRREFVSGFEIGRHEAGFRFVFPMFHSNSFVGTVETSMSFSAFRTEMERRFPGEYFLIVRKKLIDQRMLDQEKNGMVPSPFSQAYVQERLSETLHKNHLSTDKIFNLSRQIRGRADEMLLSGKPFYTSASAHGSIYSVYFMPINDVSGSIEAYLVSINAERSLDVMKDSMYAGIIISTFFAVLICVMILALIDKARALTSSNRLFRAAINALPYPFHVVDVASFTISLANQQACVDGKCPEGLTCHAVTHASTEPCSTEDHPCPVKMAMIERRPVVVEHIHKDDAGVDRFVEVHGCPIFEDNGEIKSCIEFAIDITERKQLQSDLMSLAETDPLTGAYNRRKFFQVMEIELSRASRYGRPLSVLMIDVDNFKQINDNYGHDVGDAVLRDLVRIFQIQIRKSDCLARSGGEEFLMLIPETSQAGAVVLADKIIGAVKSYRFRGVENLTISVGIASFIRGDSADELIKRADQALYKAKRDGKDRVESIL